MSQHNLSCLLNPVRALEKYINVIEKLSILNKIACLYKIYIVRGLCRQTGEPKKKEEKLDNYLQEVEGTGLKMYNLLHDHMRILSICALLIINSSSIY